jgi:hypothetical protein
MCTGNATRRTNPYPPVYTKFTPAPRPKRVLASVASGPVVLVLLPRMRSVSPGPDDRSTASSVLIGRTPLTASRGQSSHHTSATSCSRVSACHPSTTLPRCGPLGGTGQENNGSKHTGSADRDRVAASIGVDVQAAAVRAIRHCDDIPSAARVDHDVGDRVVKVEAQPASATCSRVGLQKVRGGGCLCGDSATVDDMGFAPCGEIMRACLTLTLTQAIASTHTRDIVTVTSAFVASQSSVMDFVSLTPNPAPTIWGRREYQGTGSQHKHSKPH